MIDNGFLWKPFSRRCSAGEAAIKTFLPGGGNHEAEANRRDASAHRADIRPSCRPGQRVPAVSGHGRVSGHYREQVERVPAAHRRIRRGDAAAAPGAGGRRRGKAVRAEAALAVLAAAAKAGLLLSLRHRALGGVFRLPAGRAPRRRTLRGACRHRAVLRQLSASVRLPASEALDAVAVCRGDQRQLRPLPVPVCRIQPPRSVPGGHDLL